MNSTDLSGRLQRWLTTLQEYHPFEIAYRKGKANANADCLSRLPVPSGIMRIVDQGSNVTLSDIGSKQQNDPAWQIIYRFKENGNVPPSYTGKTLLHFHKECEQYVLEDSVLRRVCHLNNTFRLDSTVLQLCVTSTMVPSVLKEFHDDGGHLSGGKTYGRLQQRYYWKDMHKDTMDYCKSCEVCARRKSPHRQPGVPLLSPQVDHYNNYGPMQCLAIDTVGPVTSSGGNCLILTVVDMYTLWYGDPFASANNSKYCLSSHG